MDYDREEDYQEYDEQDIDGTLEALRAAWKCLPDMSLSEVLDTAMPMPFCQMQNAEIISELNDFVLQNHKQHGL